MEPFDIAKFAAERSHQNSKLSSELGRAAAQAAMYINGGTAAAVLTFIKGEPTGVKGIPIALAIYGIGLLLGAWMTFCKNKLLDARSEYWQTFFNPEKMHAEYKKDSLRKSEFWFWLSNGAFGGSMISFVIATVWLAWELYR